MKKVDLVRAVSKDANITLNESKAAVNAVFDHIRAALISGENFTIERFMTFKPVLRKARIGHSPATGEKIQIPERKTVRAKLSPRFKAELNPTEVASAAKAKKKK